MKKLFIISALVCSGLSANAQTIVTGYSCKSDDNPAFDVNCELDYTYKTAMIIEDNRIGDKYYDNTRNLRIPETVTYQGTTFTVIGYKDDVYNNVVLDMVTLPKTLKYAGKLYAHGNSTEHYPVLYLSSLKDWCDVDNNTGVFYSSCYNFTVDMANISSPNIPEGVTKIGYQTFDIFDLTSVTLPSTLKYRQ